MNVIKSVADKVLVLKNGKLIEYETSKRIFEDPNKAYTKKLISSVI